jgi:phenylacetic acid degradation operon negative regulatory protein
MVANAWDLSDLGARYAEFVEEFAGVAPTSDGAVLQSQTLLVHEWRRFPFLDPQLPADLLPAGWQGARAAELFHRRHVEWRQAAQRRWTELTT